MTANNSGMTDAFHRRSFLNATSAAMSALALAGCGDGGSGTPGPAPSPNPSPAPAPLGYGTLAPDPAGLLDLPGGFSYRILSAEGDAMSDGGRVPGNADGMGCFDLGNDKLALVRCHELSPGENGGGAAEPAYDRTAAGIVLPGGTTTIILDARSLAVERQFRSLAGTIRNCAGGVTPWGSWLSCEESVIRPGSNAGKDHGWVFEVPAGAAAQVDPVPLTAMGRFNHEAAAVDPATGYVYLTEDRPDGLLYRFIPAVAGQLAGGGRLQALAIAGRTDSRNWNSADLAPGAWTAASWIDLTQTESPNDDLRQRGLAAGALRFARGEGIWMGLGELYFACTSGGAAQFGQIFRLDLRGTGQLQLYFESTAAAQFNYADNLTIAPDGQLILCEDQNGDPVDNYIRGIARDGRSYPLARLRTQTESAGVCFSPDGKAMFVNLYSPAKTLAITGPWAHLRA